MLIGFQVENFRSFKARQVFSMLAGNFTEHLETNTFDSGLKGFDRLLRTAVIYGPNAAGKTNLLRTIRFVQTFVISSATSVGAPYPYSPYKLSSATMRKRSEFQISFIQDGIRYEYGFAMGPTRIEKEWLTEFVHSGARARGRAMFDRTWDSQKKKYDWKFSSFLKGQRSVWSDSTRPEALFLSTAFQLNSTQLRPVFEWFQKRLVVIVGDVHMNAALTLKMLDEADGKQRLLPFLKEADLGIADLDLTKEPVPPGGAIINKTELMLQPPVAGGAANVITVTLSHVSENPKSPVKLDFSDESSGTQILFRTAGAWLNVIANGEVLLFDEIDTNMHPRLLQFLVKKFNSSKTNPKNAQLICTTHNTSLQNQKLFRRDQIWFVEKDRNGASRLYPLTEFRPRNDEVLETWYMRGRYGAQPVLPEGDA